MFNSKLFHINFRNVLKCFFRPFKTELLPKGGKAFINGIVFLLFSLN